jgi:hypothetical protein
LPITRPVIETCWKKTYLIPWSSMRRVIASICSRLPGWLRASSSVAGGTVLRGVSSTVLTVPPKVVGPAPSTVTLSLMHLPPGVR